MLEKQGKSDFEDFVTSSKFKGTVTPIIENPERKAEHSSKSLYELWVSAISNNKGASYFVSGAKTYKSELIRELEEMGMPSEEEFKQQQLQQIDGFFSNEINDLYEDMIVKTEKSAQAFSLEAVLNHLEKSKHPLLDLFKGHTSYVLKKLTQLKIQKKTNENVEFNTVEKAVAKLQLSPEDVQVAEWSDIALFREHYREKGKAIWENALPSQQTKIEASFKKKVQSLHKEWKSQREKWESKQLKEAQVQIKSVEVKEGDILAVTLDKKELESRLMDECLGALKERGIHVVKGVDAFVNKHVQALLKQCFAERDTYKAEAKAECNDIKPPEPKESDTLLSLKEFERQYLLPQITHLLVPQLPEYAQKRQLYYEAWKQKLALFKKEGVTSPETADAVVESTDKKASVNTSETPASIESASKDEKKSPESSTIVAEEKELSEDATFCAEKYNLDVEVFENLLNNTELEEGLGNFDQLVEQNEMFQKLMVEKGGGSYLAPAFILSLGKHNSPKAILESIKKLPGTKDEELYLTQVRSVFARDNQSDLGSVFNNTKAVEASFRKGLSTQLNWKSDSVQAFVKSTQEEEDTSSFEEVLEMDETNIPSFEVDEEDSLEEDLKDLEEEKQEAISEFEESEDEALEEDVNSSNEEVSELEQEEEGSDEEVSKSEAIDYRSRHHHKPESLSSPNQSIEEIRRQIENITKKAA